MAVLTSRNPLFAYVCNMSHIVEPKLCILLSLVWQEIQEVAVVYLLKYVLVSGRSYDEITLARWKENGQHPYVGALSREFLVVNQSWLLEAQMVFDDS